MISFSSLPMMRDTPISDTASVGPETDFWLSEMKKLLNASAFSPSDLATVSFAEIGGSSFFGDDRSDFINLYRFRCGTPVTSPCAVVDTKADLASLREYMLASFQYSPCRSIWFDMKCLPQSYNMLHPLYHVCIGSEQHCITSFASITSELRGVF